MKAKYILWILLGVITWIGCDDDEALTPSDDPEYQLVLPQGDHDYDNRIVDWFERTGVYILYKFKPADIYFNLDYAWAEMYRDTTLIINWFPLSGDIYVKEDTVYLYGEKHMLGITHLKNGSWENYSVEDNLLREEHAKIYYAGGSTVSAFHVLEAEEAYVEKQFQLLEELFLKIYPDSLLRKYMPLKIILGRDLERRKTSVAKESLSYYIAYNNLIINYGDKCLDTLSDQGKNNLKRDLSAWFISDRLSEALTLDAFYEMTDYYWVGLPAYMEPEEKEFYSLGILSLSESSDLDRVKKDDLLSYVTMIISNPYSTLIAEPENGDYDATSFKGILHEKKDVYGYIREKYDILIEEFSKMGIDLQAIGGY